MARIILIYGVIGGVIIAVLGQISMQLFADEMGPLGMAIGYLSMLIALSTVLVGVKQYRDQQRGGVIGFWRALGVGFAIAAIASIFYVVNWEIYLVASGRDFIGEYTAMTIEKAREAGKSGAALQAEIDKARQMAAAYQNPLFRLPITFTEILPVGLLVALVSAVLLRNPRFLPARAPIGAEA